MGQQYTIHHVKGHVQKVVCEAESCEGRIAKGCTLQKIRVHMYVVQKMTPFARITVQTLLQQSLFSGGIG